MTGRICNIVADRGFFFIKGDDERQYFAHKSSLLTPKWIYDIEHDDVVQFDPTAHEKGPRAENIVVNRLNV